MLLVTAFKPFGIVRKLQDKNASLEVLEALRKEGLADCSFAVLSVDDAGIGTLRRTLAEGQFRAVMSMGESLALPPGQVVLEPFAIRCRPRIFDIPLPGLEDIAPSSAAELLGASPADSAIGRGYCNAAYLAGIEWASGGAGRSAVFVHIPVIGDRAEHVTQIRKILWQLRSQ